MSMHDNNNSNNKNQPFAHQLRLEMTKADLQTQVLKEYSKCKS
jgi:hypothetical protein